jgi:hypothetical protein
LFPRILRRFRECVRTRHYVVTLHAEEEIANDELSIFDVERAILTGEIIERQRDQERDDWKYLIRGKTIEEKDVIIVVKLGSTAKMIIITVFLEL